MEVAPSGCTETLVKRISHLEAIEREYKCLKEIIAWSQEQNMDYIEIKIHKNAIVSCNSWTEILDMCKEKAIYKDNDERAGGCI